MCDKCKYILDYNKLSRESKCETSERKSYHNSTHNLKYRGIHDSKNIFIFQKYKLQ